MNYDPRASLSEAAAPSLGNSKASADKSLTQTAFEGLADDCRVLHQQVAGLVDVLQPVLRGTLGKDDAEKAGIPPAVTTFHGSLLGLRQSLGELHDKLRDLLERLEL